jgi:hypothetical protein
MLVLMRDAKGEFHRTPVQVLPDGTSVTIHTYPAGSGDWTTHPFSGALPPVTLTTQYTTRSNRRLTPLTTDVLLEMIGEKFRYIEVHTPSVHATDDNGGIWSQSMFFGRIGIPVLGVTEQSKRRIINGSVHFNYWFDE